MSKLHGKKKWMIPAPAIAVKAMAFFLQRFAWFPITVDQLTMLLESNVCDSKEHFELFQIEQIPYNTDTLNYLNNY